MEEERHKCRLCSRSFSNGRALGGHMKAHLSTFSLQHQNLNNTFKSTSDPHLSFFLHDTDSDTDSKTPTRKRSKRSRRFNPESSPEPASSISDTSPEEDVAISLVMLSMENPGKDQKSFRCGKCRKTFRSGRALFGHRKVCRKEEDDDEEGGMINGGKWKIFKCPYCCKVFGSGQALGGHKRSHQQDSIRTAIDGKKSLSKVEIGLDLNLPAPLEDDDYSVVSDV